MKRLIAVTAVPLPLVGCPAVQNAADSIRRNFGLRQPGYGLSPKDSLIPKDGLENVSSKI